MLDLLERREGLAEGSTIVVDRGMAFAENIAELRWRSRITSWPPDRKNATACSPNSRRSMGSWKWSGNPRPAIPVRRSRPCGSRLIRQITRP